MEPRAPRTMSEASSGPGSSPATQPEARVTVVIYHGAPGSDRLSAHDDDDGDDDAVNGETHHPPSCPPLSPPASSPPPSPRPRPRQQRSVSEPRSSEDREGREAGEAGEAEDGSREAQPLARPSILVQVHGRAHQHVEVRTDADDPRVGPAAGSLILRHEDEAESSRSTTASGRLQRKSSMKKPRPSPRQPERDNDNDSGGTDGDADSGRQQQLSASFGVATTATLPSDDVDELPFPGFVPETFYHFDQRHWLRMPCLRLITNPYPLYYAPMFTFRSS